MAKHFAITSLDEAMAYLDHPVLGQRLRECTELVIKADKDRIRDIFHYPDDVKFQSCMTLFEAATALNEIFSKALEQYFEGVPDSMTLQLLGRRAL